jgi:hypothetical protein
MAAIAVCLVAVVVAMTGGPQAPFTQWAAPQPPATANNNPQQAGTRPFDHATIGGTVGSHASSGGAAPGGAKPGQPGSSVPGAGTSATPTSSPARGKPAKPSPSALPGRGKSNGRGGPHATASPTPTA